MPNPNVGLSAAWAAQVCGMLSLDVNPTEGHLILSDKTILTFDPAPVRHLVEYLGGGTAFMGWACVNYSYNNGPKLEGVSLAKIKCPPFTKYVKDAGAGYCLMCSNNTASIAWDGSSTNLSENFYTTNTTCNYCMRGYYRVGTDTTSCTYCPNAGNTDGDGHLGIGRCYIAAPADGTDSTGAYVYHLGRCDYQ